MVKSISVVGSLWVHCGFIVGSLLWCIFKMDFIIVGDLHPANQGLNLLAEVIVFASLAFCEFIGQDFALINPG